ncbi:hypothetical protein, partial [Staphylococcus haemolyticus]
DLTIKNEYQIQLQFDTHLGLHFHFLYSKTELLKHISSTFFIKVSATIRMSFSSGDPGALLFI